MLDPVPSPWLVPPEGLPANPATAPLDSPGKKALKRSLEGSVAALYELQRKLYADDRFSLLLVFQALDAAGKDSTIRKVLSGVNPAGCHVTSFKAPSKEELDHDFLWRTSKALPERGRIGVFNRSYYEEVLVVRVHPEYLVGQRLPDLPQDVGEEAFWARRLESIAEHEKHLARNGTVILKFWLNVGRDEQARRILDRIHDPRKNWKYNPDDVDEREHWDAYQAAFRAAIDATNTSWAPWYAIPADDKPYMRATVADIVRRRLESLPLRWPTLPQRDRDTMEEVERLLREDLGG